MKTRSCYPVLCLTFLSLVSGAGLARAQADDPKPFPPEAVAITEDAANHLPRVISRVEAVYPAALKNSGKEEDVFVVFVVTAKGEVTRARVAFGQIPGCEQAALAAISLWKFTPGLVMGHAVNTRLFVRFPFKEAKP
jgi:TonB family protein